MASAGTAGVEQEPPEEIVHTPRRRGGYSSEPLEWETVAKIARTVHPKHEDSRKRIEAALRSNFLFARLGCSQFQEIIDAMEPEVMAKDTVVIQEGTSSTHSSQPIRFLDLECTHIGSSARRCR
jgi:hypothetical protein